MTDHPDLSDMLSPEVQVAIQQQHGYREIAEEIANQHVALPQLLQKYDQERVDSFLTKYTDHLNFNNGGDVVTVKLQKSGLHFFNLEEPISREDFITKRGEIDHKELAGYIMRQTPFVTFRDTNNILVYKDGTYHRDGQTYIREIATELMGEKATRHYRAEIIDHIKSMTYIERDDFTADAKYIILENGVYNLETGDLTPHTPEIYSLNKLPVKYDPDADCPTIRKFLHDIMRPEDVKIVQEGIGYTLLRDTPFDKAFMLLGEGSNGKSWFLDLLETFIGSENTSGLPLQRISKRFAATRLHGKLANIHTDLPEYSMKQTDTFKAAVSGDKIDAEKKGAGYIRFAPYATFWYSANELPEVYDDSDGFFRRWIIINFPNKFTDDPDDGNPDKDNTLFDRLVTDEELSGLFNWALKGLRRLMDQGHFTYSMSTEEIREDYQRKSNSLLAFCKDHVTKSTGNSMDKKDFYTRYIKYCDKWGVPAKTQRQVGSDLQRVLSFVEPSKSGSTRTWLHIAVTDLDSPLGDDEVDEETREIRQPRSKSPSIDVNNGEKLRLLRDTRNTTLPYIHNPDCVLKLSSVSQHNTTKDEDDKDNSRIKREEILDKIPDDGIAEQEIIQILLETTDADEAEIEKHLKFMRINGWIHEPRPGKIHII